MAPIVLVLGVRADGGSYAWGGLVSSSYSLALALGQPLLGRVVDRIGQTLPTAGGALVASMATTCLILPSVTTGWGGLVLAGLAGLAAPPL